jgi:hypothetical protein
MKIFKFNGKLGRFGTYEIFNVLESSFIETINLRVSSSIILKYIN